MIDWLASLIREATIRAARIRLVRIKSRTPNQVKRMENKRGLT